MKKSVNRLSLNILVVFLILISFNLLASANNQAPEILEKELTEQNYNLTFNIPSLEKELTEQNYNISIECSLNYDINLNDSARATIYIEIENLDRNTLSLNILRFKISEIPRNITNVKVEIPHRPYNRSNCSSLDECLQKLKKYEYCYYVNKFTNTTKKTWDYYFCVAVKHDVRYHIMRNLYISYSIDNITDRTRDNIKYLHIPPKDFDSFLVVTKNGQSIPIQAKSYNILINLPQDRYYYSQLETIPHPYPDVTSLHGNNYTRVIVPAYKIQKDKYMLALDILGFIALTLGFISIFLAVKDYKHKWIIRGIDVLSYGMILIFAYFYLY
jgi:hypothetical protein